MNVDLLFRKRTPLTEWGLPWLRGGETHPWAANRNPNGEACVSAILVRSLLSALDGGLSRAQRWNYGVSAAVASHSRAGYSASCWLEYTLADGSALSRAGLPHGEPDKITYHLGVLAIVETLVDPIRALDFWQAYAQLLAAYKIHGKEPELKEALCRAVDELYYWCAPSKL